jgi:hypothetical protein
MPANTIYVGRPSMWGNPFRAQQSPLSKEKWLVCFGTVIAASCPTKQEAQAEAVRLFEMWFNPALAEVGTDLYDFRSKYGWKGFELANVAPYLLSGKNLACWCRPDEPCHADSILRIANKET